jgi:hypothetical protein
MGVRTGIAAAGAVVLLVAAGSAAAAADEGAKTKAAPPAKWEYQVLTHDQIADLAKKDFAAGLNKLGADGWELVAVEPRTDRDHGAKPSGQAAFYFKRPAARAEGARAEAGPSGEGDFRVFRLKNASAVDTAKLLQELFGDNRRIRIVADPNTNSLLVRGTDIDLATVAALLDKCDVPGK